MQPACRCRRRCCDSTPVRVCVLHRLCSFYHCRFCIQDYQEIMDMIDDYYFTTEYTGKYTMATWFYK